MSKYIKNSEVKYINISDVLPNHSQPRSIFNDKPLQELSESIRTHGVLEPVLVVKESNFYKIIAGERRYRASRMAGLTRIPAIIISGTAEQLSEIAIVENLHRQQLNPLEEAEAIKMLMDSNNLTQEQVAVGLGRSRPAVANLLRLLTLPLDIQLLVKEGKLSQGHARALLAIKDSNAMISMANKCVEEKWSVFALSKEIERLSKVAPKKVSTQKKKVQKRLSPEMEGMIEDMERVFQIPVTITGDEKKGKLIIEYSTPEEIAVIYDVIQKMKK